MKVFSLKRLIGAAAVYGLVKYVKANGGLKAAFGDLKLKVNNLVGSAKPAVDTDFATNTGNGPSKFESSGMREGTAAPSSYASYKVGDDRNLH